MTRRPRARKARGASRVGELFTVEVGPVAHGGHCIARVPTGVDGQLRVVFVRHAIPGERVVLVVTEGTDGDRFWRADAVEVLEASPDRVEAPCPVAGPGLCGGCDFQHVGIDRQRRLKADVVEEQLRRLAGLERDVVVQGVGVGGHGRDDGLRWRTRMQYVDLPAGGADGAGRGLRRHRSREVVPVEDCLIAHPHALEQSPALRGTTVTEVVAAGAGERSFEVDGDGFWQVHEQAPSTLVDHVLELLAVRPGERVLDLYAGVGLFARYLADATGPTGAVVAVEGDHTASEHARDNLAGLRGVSVVRAPVDEHLAATAGEQVDLVVLDPPREGAKRAVVEGVVARRPRAVAYVACDPAALARDLAIFAEHGYGLVDLRALDLFPMTHHVECVALLERASSSTAVSMPPTAGPSTR